MLFKNKKKNKSNENSTKNWLPIKEIKNGIICLKSGEYLKILEISPINFTHML